MFIIHMCSQNGLCVKSTSTVMTQVITTMMVVINIFVAIKCVCVCKLEESNMHG